MKNFIKKTFKFVKNLFIEHPRDMGESYFMHMFFTLAMMCKSVILAKLFHFSMMIFSGLAIYAFTKRYFSRDIAFFASALFFLTPGIFTQATYAYIAKKPLVALSTSGGMAQKIAGTFFDTRKAEKIKDAKTPKKAVDMILKLVKEKKEEALSELDKELLHDEEKQDWKLIAKRKKKCLQ